MDKYEFLVALRVEVEAFNPDDAKEMLEDIFGVGSDCGATIKLSSVKPLKSDKG